MVNQYLRDDETERLIFLWGRDREMGGLTAAERSEMDALAKRIIWPPPIVIPPPGTPPPTIIIPKPYQTIQIASAGGSGNPEA